MVGGRWAWLAVLVAGFDMSCVADTSSVAWQIQVADGVSPELERIDAALRIGGCGGTAIYEATLRRDGSMTDMPPLLARGRYAVTAEGFTLGCERVAEGCLAFDVPEENDLLLMLLPVDAEMMCSVAETCVEGACEPTIIDCSTLDEGDSCGLTAGFVCIDGSCVASRCGDGVHDPASEECDDGNPTRGDGCEPITCTFSCSASTECDDGDSCTPGDTCSVEHVCVRGVARDDLEPCTSVSVEDGVCRSGTCVDANCGNELLDPGEDCDDGNTDDRDGCRINCRFTCEEDIQCDDDLPCNGQETCVDNVCVAGTPVSCDDAEPCTTDVCNDAADDPANPCEHTFIDADKDGVSPMTCAALPGGDCDDTRITRYPGAPEACDDIDNDCDSRTDEDAAEVTCYQDDDGDGFGVMSTATPACDCADLPGGTWVTSPTMRFDCHDVPGLGGASVHPNVTLYSAESYCVPAGASCSFSFDWNCNGVIEKRWNGSRCECPAPGEIGLRTGGWVGANPACGQTGTWQTCEYDEDVDPFTPAAGPMVIGGACRTVQTSRRQECR